MKTYLKTLTRMFKKHVTRFISIICMVLISVGFVAGVGMSTDKIYFSLTDHYVNGNVSDFIIKDKSGDGFSDGQIQAVKDICGGEKNVNTGMSVDVKLGGSDKPTRIYFLDNFNPEEGGDWTVNVPEIISKNDYEGNIAYAEQSDNIIKGVAAGEKISLDFREILSQLAKQNGEEEPDFSMVPPAMAGMFVKEVTVCGTAKSPLTFANDGEPSYLNPADVKMPDNITDANALITLENILYMSSDVIPAVFGNKLLKTGDIYAAAKERGKFDAFGKNYKKFVNEQSALITQAIVSAAPEGQTVSAEDVEIVTLYKNYSFVSLHSYGEKVKGIGLVLMVAFLFVTALVVLSNMTRLMEEERAQIACLRTLGYSSFRIIFKYALFAMIATGIGGVGSYFVAVGLAYLICYVFNYSFAMPPISPKIALGFYLIVYFVIVAITLFATLTSGFKMTGETPANLLRPKPPKEGKKVFLERIPFLWNRISFRYKSTLRNVLRYLSRFLMTVIAVAVSTSLVLAGLALLDVCLFGGIDSPSVMAIAVIVIIFAGLLTAVVIYTLTNINISERNRELATLKVLGYHDKEVSGYIYREIYIDTIVGVIFGYPLSLAIMTLLFNIMAVGSITGVSWFWWLIAPVIVLFFTFTVTLMLRRKIVKIDMNESLKAVE